MQQWRSGVQPLVALMDTRQPKRQRRQGSIALAFI